MTSDSEAAQAEWRVAWEKTLAAAENEGEVTIYGPFGTQYESAIRAFEKSYPKIKVNYVPGSGTVNSQRIMAERRAGKYLADAFISGPGSQLIMAKGNALAPVGEALILPEAKDQAAWLSGKHVYADPEERYVFVFAGDVSYSFGVYNKNQVKADEIKSHWDVLNPKWKGKLVTLDPRGQGLLQVLRGTYYNRKLGADFLRRLFTEMDIVVQRDTRLMIDWVAGGKYAIYLFARENDMREAKSKGLPVETLVAPPDEQFVTAGFGYLTLLADPAHPNAVKIFVNWMVSREGQLQWQKETDSNSMRTDIPKDMITDQQNVPQKGIQYLIAASPQYSDTEADHQARQGSIAPLKHVT